MLPYPESPLRGGVIKKNLFISLECQLVPQEFMRPPLPPKHKGGRDLPAAAVCAKGASSPEAHVSEEDPGQYSIIIARSNSESDAEETGKKGDFGVG